MNMSSEMHFYRSGFGYQPITDDIKARIYGVSYKEDSIVPLDSLHYVIVKHINFSGTESTGELICNREVTASFLEIFYQLYIRRYPIAKIRLIDEYGADDKISMADNNTSCFNYRTIAGTDILSYHAYGTAIDINPLYNPYCKPDGYISPPGSEPYVDRSIPFLHKIDSNDLCFQLFQKHGFIWGGNWLSCKDYQHFQKKPLSLSATYSKITGKV